jgi:thiamine-phosphate pyrophosphorylase
LQKIRLYAITMPRKDVSYEEQVEQACLGGVDAVQLRDKELSPKNLCILGAKLYDICRKHNVLFIINDRPDIALAINADGVHIGADDIPVEYARQMLGPRRVIGLSCETLGQATSAQEIGADYIGVGPIYSTPLKAEKEARGVDIIRMIKKRVKIPVIAIGGINLDNVEEVIKTGADGVAVIRSVMGAKDIKEQAQKMKQRIIDSEKFRMDYK